MKFYGYLLWIFVCAGCGYLERWIAYGQYDWLWFGFQLGAIFFFAMARRQILIDREDDPKNKKNLDNPFS